MNHENAIYYCINRVVPNYGPFYMRATPSTRYIDRPKLRFIWAATTSGAPDSSNHVCGLDNRSFILVGEVVQCLAARAATYSSARKERSVFPLTVMTRRGPCILSLR